MRITLISDIAPCKNYTAGLILESLCLNLIAKGHKVSCFIIKNAALDFAVSEDIKSAVNIEYTFKPIEKWGVLGWVFSLVCNNWNALFKLPIIAKKAAAFAEANRAEMLWYAVQGQTLIKIIRHVSKIKKLPYCVQVWDPPQWWLDENKFDRFTKRSVMKAFGKALKAARCCLAASYAMAKRYTALYSCACVALLPGLPEEAARGNAEIKQTGNAEFRIIMCGQMYAAEEFYALIRALDLLEWKLDERKVVLEYYGSNVTLHTKRSANILYKGWLNQRDLLNRICGADLAYCPYWFSPRYSLPCSLSFPSKLTTYLKAGVPVFFHGPRLSSPGVFLEEANAGMICESLDEKQIASQLKIACCQAFRDELSKNGYEAYAEHLTAERMYANFEKALGI